MANHKHPKKHPKPHLARPQGPRRRNADEIPDDILLPLAPIAPPMLTPQATQAMLPYGMARYPAARPRSKTGGAIRRKAGAIAGALKPQPATITKEHLIGVGANAAGGIVTALAANELVDNIGVMPMAISATVAGGLGSAFLTGNWQKVAQGVLGAGVGQLGTAYLAERGLKKAAAAQKGAGGQAAPPTVAAAGKRNAYLAEPDDDTMLRAIERTERRIGAMLADERNARPELGGDAGYVDDPYDGFPPFAYAS